MSILEFEGLDSLLRGEGDETFLKGYQLRPGHLVIDAKSVSEKIYLSMPNRLDVFGGKYDSYDKEVKHFFDKLAEIEITPYVIFFGGHQITPWKLVRKYTRKVARQRKDLPFCNEEGVMYPLCLREVFLSEVLRRNLNRLQLLYDDYIRVALIAKRLKVPVLANNPVYYLFDIRYIPFDTLCMETCASRLVAQKGTTDKVLLKYYNCKVIKSEAILKFLGLERDRTLFPVIVALLGKNDLFYDFAYRVFLQNLGISVHNQPTDKYNELLTNWVKTTDLEQIESTVIRQYEGDDGKNVWSCVQEIVSSYSLHLNTFFQSFQIDQSTAPPELRNLAKIQPDKSKESFLNEKILKLDYPPGFNDLINLRKYFLFEQIELLSFTSTHTASLYIISTIFSILRNSYEQFRVYMKHIRAVPTDPAQIVKPYKLKIPDLLEVEQMDLEKRRGILRDILVLSCADEVDDLLTEVPEDWKLLLIAIKYFINYKRNWNLIYAVILCKLVLSKIDPMIGGFHRTVQGFKEAFEAKLKKKYTIKKHERTLSIDQLMEKVDEEECAIAMDKIVHFFELNNVLTVNQDQALCRELLLELLEFQSCLLHVDYLNSLLNCPYEKCDFGKILNCTFIFNCADHLIKSKQSFGYIIDILRDNTSTLGRIVIRIVDHLEKCCKVFY